MAIAGKRKRLTGKQKCFLAAVVIRGGNRTAAAADSGIERTIHYTWLKNPEYAEAHDEAQKQAEDVLEDEAIRRATNGTRKVVVSGGKIVMIPMRGPDGLPIFDADGRAMLEPLVESVYSDRLMEVLLKGKKPMYSDRKITADINVETVPDFVVMLKDDKPEEPTLPASPSS